MQPPQQQRSQKPFTVNWAPKGKTWTKIGVPFPHRGGVCFGASFECCIFAIGAQKNVTTFDLYSNSIELSLFLYDAMIDFTLLI
jgi:hypothetical protein